MLFIIVLEALSLEFRTGCPLKLLYVEHMVAITDSLEELLVKVQMWKSGMEKKCLRVNMGKMKIMVSGAYIDLLKQSRTHPSAVCVDFYRNRQQSYLLWWLLSLSPQKMQWHQGTHSHVLDVWTQPIDRRPMEVVRIGEDRLEVIPEFCYLGGGTAVGPPP